jgi:hypothetical protein
MRAAEFYPHPVESVTLEETHISWVFLTGDVVYKIKKPVDLGFLDFSTLEKREHDCRREVALNRRLTSGIYLDVVAVVETESGYRLEGAGKPVEYAVKMRQLDAGDSLEALLGEKKVDTAAVEALAATLADFYDAAGTGAGIDEIGSRRTVARNCEENFRQIAAASGDGADQRRLQIVAAATRGFLENRPDLFETRIREGRIRDCHGDLRPDHIYLTREGIQIIDCIEFNDRFRYSDVACDLAFLAMELDFGGHPQVAGRLITAFAEQAGDRGVYPLLDFYKCYRAMVRVKVDSLRLQQGDVDESDRANLKTQIGDYMALAFRYAVQFSRPMLWVFCGMVASGKSTAARALAEALSIQVLRSDVVRKRLFDRSGQQSDVVPHGEGIYSQDATAQTYGRLLREAQAEIEKGRSLVLDATFGRESQRREALRLAEETGAAIVFVECLCSEAATRKRLAGRSGGDSVSDARLQHLDKLKAAFERPDELPAACRVRVDTEAPVETVLQKILAYLATPSACPAQRPW